MERFLIHSIDFILLVVLGFLLLKYWSRRIAKSDLKEFNLSYGILVSAQILGLGILLATSYNSENLTMLDQFELFGGDAISFWKIVGIKTILISVFVLLSNVISYVLLGFVNFTNQNLTKSIKQNTIGIALSYSMIYLSLITVVGIYILAWLNKEIIDSYSNMALFN